MIRSQSFGKTVVVTLSHPPVNAIDGAWVDRFDAVLDSMERRGDCTVLHIRSDQRVFSAGADLKLMRACFAERRGPDAMVAMVRRLQALYARIERLPQVTVAEIGGPALGGGFELTLACDLRVASFDARFGLPEVRLGLVPGAGGTQRLSRLCGGGVAQRLILSAEIVDGETARALGLVQWAVMPRELSAMVTAVVAGIAGLPPAALASCKRCMAEAAAPGVAGFLAELQETRTLLDHPDTRARVAAFLDRTPAEAASDDWTERRRVAP